MKATWQIWRWRPAARAGGGGGRGDRQIWGEAAVCGEQEKGGKDNFAQGLTFCCRSDIHSSKIVYHSLAQMPARGSGTVVGLAQMPERGSGTVVGLAQMPARGSGTVVGLAQMPARGSGTKLWKVDMKTFKVSLTVRLFSFHRSQI